MLWSRRYPSSGLKHRFRSLWQVNIYTATYIYQCLKSEKLILLVHYILVNYVYKTQSQYQIVQYRHEFALIGQI